jgi:prepilin-type N-terminal cleavage/methylation domain-containing protein
VWASGGGSFKSLILNGFQAYRTDKDKRRDKSAFTLAEVLITLGIIGVVAAMTIPTLMTKIKTARYRTAFKKGLSTLNQAVKMNYANYGWDFASLTRTSNCESYTNSGENSENPASVQSICALLNGALTGKTFNGQVYCDWDDIPNNVNYVVNYVSFEPNGGNRSGADLGSPSNYIRYTLADGTIIGVTSNVSNCTKEKALDDSWHGCIGFIDVNGIAPPNSQIFCEEKSDTDSVTSSNYKECKLGKDMGDIVPVFFYDQTVIPATNAAMALFNGK